MPAVTIRLLLCLLALALVLPAPAPLADDAGEVRTRAFRKLNRGVAAYKRGQYAKAVAELEESAALALNSFRANYYLGLALIGDRRYLDAIDALNVALDLDPDHLRALVAVGDSYLKMGDIDEARAGYFRALKMRAAYPPALDGLARAYEAKSDDDNAIATYRRAIDSDEGYAPAYTNLGDLYLRQERYEEAVQLLEEAISIRPDYGPGLNRLAVAYGRLGLDNKAVATIQEAIRLEPNNASHPATLGGLQLLQGFVSSAEDSFNRALELDPALPEARWGLSEVARRRGNYVLALEQLDIALADERTDARMRKRLTEFRDKVAAEKDRVELLETRVAAAEAEPVEYGDLAMLYAERGLWSEAAELQQNAEQTPEQQERLAYMLFQSGRYGEAHRIYAELARLTPTATTELNNGVTLALLGNDTAAVEAFRRALVLDPKLRQAELYLANALLRLGQEEEAAQTYRSFLQGNSRGEDPERVRRILRLLAPDLLPTEPEPSEQAELPASLEMPS